MAPTRRTRTLLRRCSVTLVGAVLLAACGGGDDPTDSTATTTTTAVAPAETATTDDVPSTTSQPARITVLVTNDDGIEAPGIDVLVGALAADGRFEVVVVAPLTNQSGSSDTKSDAAPDAVGAATASGFAGHAVQGFPADAVMAAFDQLDIDADLAISGINSGQNIGPLAELSGTVGAARTAARFGVPAIAISAGLADEIDFDQAASVLLAVLDDRLDDIMAAADSGEIVVLNVNVPTCTEGSLRGVLDVAAGNEDRGQGASADCTSTVDGPFVDDVDAYVHGYASVSGLAF